MKISPRSSTSFERSARAERATPHAASKAKGHAAHTAPAHKGHASHAAQSARNRDTFTPHRAERAAPVGNLPGGQAATVREMAAAARRAGVPPELPIMTALVESRFRNLNHGDRDSVGMFQQRAAWGPFSVRHNPIKSAEMFFKGGQGGQRGAVDFKNQFKSRGPSAYGQWAQAVQVSAFPGRYQQRLGEARRLLRQAGVKFGLK